MRALPLDPRIHLCCRDDRGAAVKWLILLLFMGGMLASLNWYEAATRERKLTFGLMAVAAFVLVLALGNTIL
jgi:hypothetical protein